jgi:hypothetical protein
MSSSLATAGKNALLDSAATWPPTYVSLHSGDPGAAGTSNELAGGAPAYARKPITWGAANNGSKANVATFPVFDIPPGSTVAFAGLWSDIAGTYLGCIDLTTHEVYAGQGTYTLNAASITL